MDGPRDYHTKWNKPETEGQISYDITYMWIKNMIQVSLFTKEKQIHRHGKQTWLLQGKRVKGGN